MKWSSQRRRLPCRCCGTENPHWLGWWNQLLRSRTKDCFWNRRKHPVYCVFLTCLFSLPRSQPFISSEDGLLRHAGTLFLMEAMDKLVSNASLQLKCCLTTSFTRRYASSDIGRHKRNYWIGFFTVVIVVCFVSLMQVWNGPPLWYSVSFGEAITSSFELRRNKLGSRIWNWWPTQPKPIDSSWIR